jgi:hypothetical protein
MFIDLFDLVGSYFKMSDLYFVFFVVLFDNAKFLCFLEEEHVVLR